MFLIVNMFSSHEVNKLSCIIIIMVGVSFTFTIFPLRFFTGISGEIYDSYFLFFIYIIYCNLHLMVACFVIVNQTRNNMAKKTD